MTGNLPPAPSGILIYQHHYQATIRKFRIVQNQNKRLVPADGAAF